MYKIIVGNISPARAEDWFRKDENPYAVWEGDALITQTCNVGTWCSADDYLRDHISVDWGSFAWKANKKELREFFKVCGWKTTELNVLDAKKDYAVVFIETVWGDSA